MKETSRIGGVLKGTSKIAYAFDLPNVANEETAAYLQTVTHLFLDFLNKESEKPCDFVRFGGLDFKKAEDRITLSVAFCPFEEREYRAKAEIFLDEQENILRILKEKRSR